MARYLTSNTLIASVKRRAMLPENSITFSKADFLAFANEEMDMAIMPYVMSYHEDYFLYTIEIPIQNNTSVYEIPYRAVGSKLMDIAYRDSSNQIFEMTRITKGDVSYYQFGNFNTGYGSMRIFYIEGNKITLVPTLTTEVPNGALQVTFYLRPNALVEEERAMKVQTINRTTGTITVNEIHPDYTVGQLVDLIKTRSPHTTYEWDISLMNIDTVNNTVQIDPALIPDDFTVGDYICFAEECVIPQIPTDLHSMLAQRVACRCLEALGDQQGLQAANVKLQEMEQKAATLIDSRVEEAPLKVVNRHGFLRMPRRYLRR